MDNIVKTIELLVYQNSTPSNKPIERPHGFVIDCLKYRWYDNFDLYYQPEIPKFGSRRSIIKFSESLRTSAVLGVPPMSDSFKRRLET